MDQHISSEAKVKILWVEDDTFLTNIIVQQLKKQDWELVYAVDGASALTLARKEHPTLIVLDVLLPGMDGVEVLTQLKAEEETKNIPVVMFSNFDDKQKIEQSLRLGAEAYFVKAAVDLETIIAELQKIISR